MFYDRPLHLGLLAGPDYSTSVVSVTNPELVTRAEKTLAPGVEVHGYRTVKDIMDAMNPLTGKIYLEALEYTRIGRVMCQLMYGKYPHPSTLVPGGLSATISTSSFNEYYTQLGKIFDCSKMLAAVWDDITNFFYEANPAYMAVGERPVNIGQTGIYDNVEYYDATYANCNEWGNRRYSMPGMIIDGELITTNLTDINMGYEEFVNAAFYDDWTQAASPRFATDSLGNPLSPYHPWNKQTIPRPQAKNFKEKYTWDTAPRWDRQVFETGAYGTLWTTALAGKLGDNPFIEATGDGLRIVLPRHQLPETELFWKGPERINAFERNRGRAYAMAFTSAIGMLNLLKAMEYWRRGETRVSTPYKIPKDERVSAGFWEGSRGWLIHHMHTDKGKIVNYQITTPSTLNASPRDPFGTPGPYEQAVIDTPILESVADDQVKGIDVLRAIRSFDPCMPCTTHMDTGKGTIVRELNSCGCTLE
ncbi:MAG: nickel-dependent hydrogenase large subunit [Actinomycetota bacterium]|nr:nickel-dependent hydrogenase large subunit [Actinomycetota bacterium]